MPDMRDPSFDPSTIIDLSEVSLMTSGEGLRFGRMKDGAVVVLVDAASLADSKTIIIPDNIWSSVVAHVSVRGEGTGEWHKTMAFHNDPTAKVFVVDLAGKLIEK